MQNMQQMSRYIHQKPKWPAFHWDNEHLISLLGEVRNLQGKLIGSMQTLRFDLQVEAGFETLALDVHTTAEIEGEILHPDQVRSSLARRLGLDKAGMIPSDRHVDGIVDMMVEAVQHYDQALSKERLENWHYALFPTGRSGMYHILVGTYRDDSTGPMQVVSGAMGREIVHFQAPEADILEEEMSRFIDWINQTSHLDPVIKAGIAHLWFITLHPFDDGNGRIARAITDMLLTRADGIPQRYYSMSAQILKERKAYYSILESSQKGTLDITSWLDWFLNCLLNALKASDVVLRKVMLKHTFWRTHAEVSLNQRQILMLNKLLDGFTGKLTSSKWAKIAKCSRDTALRDIQDLMGKHILKKEAAGGRSTNYEFVNIK